MFKNEKFTNSMPNINSLNENKIIEKWKKTRFAAQKNESENENETSKGVNNREDNNDIKNKNADHDGNNNNNNNNSNNNSNNNHQYEKHAYDDNYVNKALDKNKNKKSNFSSSEKQLITTQILSTSLTKDYTLSDTDYFLLKRYPQDIIVLCKKCYDKMKNNWTETITEFKGSSVKGIKGKICDHFFKTILRNRGVILTVWEPAHLAQAFKAFGMNGVCDYMEFLRVCQLSG